MTAPGGFVAGDVLGAADMNGLPGGVKGYAEATTNQASIGTTFTDLTSLSVTFTAVTGRRYKITVYTNFFGSAANVPAEVNIYNSTAAAQLTYGGAYTGAAGGGTNNDEVSTVTATWSGAISAGSTTIKARARRGVSGSGTITSYATSTSPAFILVEDIGPT